jgi:hypothetical protein
MKNRNSLRGLSGLRVVQDFACRNADPQIGHYRQLRPDIAFGLLPNRRMSVILAD